MTRSLSIEGQTCRRCGEQAVVQGRNEPLCQACFVSYVQTKVVKRMEQFRVKNSEPDKARTLLIPLSFGVSSLSLLYILNGHLGGQLARTGRTGYHLHVVYIQLPDDHSTHGDSLLSAVKERFPRHTYSSLDLFKSAGSSVTATGSVRDEDEPRTADGDGVGGSGKSYAHLLASMTSVTSRTDVLNIIRTRAIVEHAQYHGCEAILWGSSTTKLAETVLAETAKGRGFSLPWQIADGESPWGVPFYYPMRDLLKKELNRFSTYVDPPLSSMTREVRKELPSPAASKNGSIDILMKQYFESVEDQYPSIVANVVRTTGKLELKAPADAKPCRLCKMLYTDREPSGDMCEENALRVEIGHARSQLCRGCESALPRESLRFIPD